MPCTITPPSTDLAPYIRYYWGMEEKPCGVVHPYRLIPQGCVELLFFHAAPYCEVLEQGHAQRPLGHAVLFGQQRGWFELKATGAIGLFSVSFTPQGAQLFFDMPQRELTDQRLPLSLVAGNVGAELEERIYLARDMTTRIQLLEHFLRARLSSRRLESFPRLSRVVEAIITARAEISVDVLAHCACLGTRQLERFFLRTMGMPPKQYLKIVRFQRVLATKQACPTLSPSMLALRCGFYDQAHLVREFKAMSGMTPTVYFAHCQPYSDFFTV